MKAWRRVALGEVAAEVTVGYVGPMATEYVAEGVPFLRSLNVREHRIDLTDVRYISAEFNARLRKSLLHPGDVVTVRTGKPGTTAVVPASLPIANCSDVVITRPSPDLDARWLSYYINGIASPFVASRLVGAVQQHFNVGAAKEIELLLPPIEEQRAIAATLGALDDKIEFNRRATGLLRELAVATLSADVSERRVVADVAEIRKGLSYKGAHLVSEGEGMPMVNMGNAENFGWLKRSGFKFYDGETKAKHHIARGSLLVTGVEQTWKHEIIGWPVLVPEDVDEALFTHHMLLVDFAPHNEWMRLPLWAFLYTPEARAILEGSVYGTTVATLPVATLGTLEFSIPSPDSRAIPAAESMLTRAWCLERESQALAKMRDALLPALLSGNIRVMVA